MANSIEAASATMGPPRGPSRFLKSETTVLTFRSTLEDATTDKRNLCWDAHASSIVFGLGFLGCNLRVIYHVLKSYGFKCTPQAVVRCVLRDRFVKYGKLPHPVEGTIVNKEIFEDGVECDLTVDYIDGEPTTMAFNYGPFKARTPLYGQLLNTDDGRRITVELTDDELQVRVLDPSDVDLEPPEESRRSGDNKGLVRWIF
ncbi:hypothetical protein MMC07_007770 [Pseudocyphellaria aurata]|nr:hypothetical protein [Pseudocyphellaria aurata]